MNTKVSSNKEDLAMTVLRLAVLIPVLALTAMCQQSSPKQALVPPASCPVTVPPADPFTPPEPYKLDENSFWLGTEKLWIDLSKSRIWEGWTPREPERALLTAKTFWWSVDYDPHREGNPDLKVTGRRLDGEGPPLLANKATNAFPPPATAMLVGAYVPTPGCWEITGEYKGQKLSVVVWVTPELVKPVKQGNQ
jgi:hypothetical protein